MIAKREDEHLDIGYGLSAESDDAFDYHRQSGKKKGTVGGTGYSDRPPQSQVRRVEKPSTAGRFFTAFFITILLAACAVLGWQLYLMQQKLIKNDVFVEQVSQQLDLLGNEMDQTGSSFAETGNTIETKFKFFDSEIRKLWDVSNKRNKEAIAANQASLEQFKKQLSQVTDDNKKVLASQDATDKTLSRLNSQLAAENIALRVGIEDHSKQLKLVRGELENLQKKFKTIPGDLLLRVETNAEAIEAIDAARSQMVNSINQLQSKVNQLQSVVGKSVPAS